MSDVVYPPFDHPLADDTSLIVLHDGIYQVGQQDLLDNRGPAETASFRAAHPNGIAIDVHCYALRRDDGVVLIDAGSGNTLGARLGHAGRALASAGIAPAEVTHVLLTHLHGDHALGLFDDAGGRRYPGATVWAPRDDLAHPQDDQAVRRVIDGFGAELRPVDDGEVVPGIEAFRLPGHTVGHTGYLIGSLLLVSGDVLQLGRRQGPNPSLALDSDADVARAEQTRRDLLATAADRSWTLAGSHLAFPGIATVKHEGEAFRIDALAP